MMQSSKLKIGQRINETFEMQYARKLIATNIAGNIAGGEYIVRFWFAIKLRVWY